MYVKLKDGQLERYPYTLADLKKDNPNTSFPKEPSAQDLAAFGAAPVQLTQKPQYAAMHRIVEAAPEFVDGVWKQVWVLERFDQSSAETSIRLARASALLACDWTQLADSPLSPENKALWAAYRQALRDITDQPGFPFDVQWPSAPTNS